MAETEKKTAADDGAPEAGKASVPSEWKKLIQVGLANQGRAKREKPVREAVPLRATLVADEVYVEETAVLVFHGIGDQVRYETLSQIATAIVRNVTETNGSAIDVRISQVAKDSNDDEMTARAEIRWTDSDGKKHRSDVYEAYWAPLTAGKVGYWQTIKFLFEGAWNGLQACVSKPYGRFEHYEFGQLARQPIVKKTATMIGGMMAIVLVFMGVVAFVGTLGVAMAKAYGDAHGFVSGAMAAFEAAYQLFPIHFERWLPQAYWRVPLHLLVYLFEVGLLVASYVFRYFVTSYVGSVVAYVSPYKKSEYDELRSKIQQVGMEIGELLYFNKSCSRDVPEKGYERVVMMGHSLGSVVAYDTLNRLMSLEPDEVRRKTKALITFGAPLDKTAFLFGVRCNGQDADSLFRERIACEVQPLIASYENRYNPATKTGPQWINLWAHFLNDPVSGSLLYYDLPDEQGGNAVDPLTRVQSKIDPAASVLLIGHMGYWKGKLLRSELGKFL